MRFSGRFRWIVSMGLWRNFDRAPVKLLSVVLGDVIAAKWSKQERDPVGQSPNEGKSRCGTMH